MKRLDLPSGLGIPEPEWMIRKFVELEYRHYDAIATATDSAITPLDVLLTVMVNSRISGDTARVMLDQREPVERALQRIPADLELASPQVPWEALEALFDACCRIKWVKLAVATKLLHKKRPLLVPMLDGVLSDYYRETCPGRAYGLNYAQCGVWLASEFRKDLIAAAGPLDAICAELRRQGTPLTRVRVLDALIWMEREPRRRYPSMRVVCFGRGAAVASTATTAPVHRRGTPAPMAGAVIGTKDGSDRYHLPTCWAAHRVAAHRRLQFANPAAAEAAGREPGMCCREEIERLRGRGSS